MGVYGLPLIYQNLPGWREPRSATIHEIGTTGRPMAKKSFVLLRVIAGIVVMAAR